MSVIQAILLYCCIAGISVYAERLHAKQQPKKIINGVHSPIDIKIAAIALGDGKSDQGVYIFNINCALDSCILRRISLNECGQNEQGQLGFTPKTYEWASWAGFLEGNLTGNTLELVVFQGTHHQLPAYVSLSFDTQNPPFTGLQAFKATGFIDFMIWPITDKRIEYIPLAEDFCREFIKQTLGRICCSVQFADMGVEV
jgi:hypothetical protein